MSEKMIRFIDTQYNELFKLPDGGSIVVTHPSGEQHIGMCKYLDETHFDLNGRCYHIHQFSEIQERKGAKVEIEKEPEMVGSYRIMYRIPVDLKIYVMGQSPEAAQPFATWQGYRDIPDKDWGHYWSKRSDAWADLIYRADAERKGIPYDHTQKYKRTVALLQNKTPFMLYELIPVPPEEHSLFFSQDTDPERLGIVGHLRADFDSGSSFLQNGLISSLI